jgi:agmatinase
MARSNRPSPEPEGQRRPERPWLEPPAWQEGPRVSGPFTFMRIPPARDLTQVDVAVLGIPFDATTFYRPGARFGPQAVRQASAHLRPYPRRPEDAFPPFDRLRVVDYGDVNVLPVASEENLQRIRDTVSTILAAGAFPLCLGGDHSVTLPVLRAIAPRFGPVGLVHFDAHPDFWPPLLGHLHYHGSTFRLATEEGLIDLARSIQVGIRGSISSAIIEEARAAGFLIVTADQAAQRGIERVLEQVHERAQGPVYVSLDIDCVDPAFAPGTGTPEVAGFTSREIIALVRGLRGLRMVGFDLVEVAPAYDHAEITALLGATLVYEYLRVLADAIP